MRNGWRKTVLDSGLVSMVKEIYAKASRQTEGKGQRETRRDIPFYGDKRGIREGSRQGQGGRSDHIGISAARSARRLAMAHKKTRRRDNGDGSVFQKGSSWFLRYWHTAPIDGVNVRKQKCTKLAEVCDRYRCIGDLKDLVKEQMNKVSAASKCSQPGRMFTDYIEKTYLPHVKEEKREFRLYSG